MSDQTHAEAGKPTDSQAAAAPLEGELKSTPEEAVPDPDEDDLDDLDDMLNDFSAFKVQPDRVERPQAPARPGVGETGVESPPSDDDFATQLQAGMAELLGVMENSPEMQAQLETMFKDFGGEAAATEPSHSSNRTASSALEDTSFQNTIRQTMERMKTSGDRATSAVAADAESSDDFMAELLKQMQTGGGLEGEANEADFSKMLLGMMEQLTNKEILYEPMKELKDRFPAWLATNRDIIDKDNLARFEHQQMLVGEIVAKFEEPTYADSTASDREYIVERMQKMQAAGAPPSELVGGIPSAQEAFNVPDESCNPQ